MRYLIISSILLSIISCNVFAGILDPKIISDAQSGRAEDVRKLLDTGVDINIKNIGGVTALMAASSGDHIDVVKLLIERGANINAATNSGDTALAFACWKGHFRVAEFLVGKKANVNTRGGSGRSPIFVAAYFGNIEIVRLLLDHGADPYIKSYDGVDAVQAFSKKNPAEKDLAQRMMAMESLASSISDMEQRSDSSYETVACVEKEDSNLTDVQSKAIRYLLRKKLASAMGLKGAAEKSNICIEKIIANDKVEIRGDTVVSYLAHVMFPKGNRTECLGNGSATATSERLNKRFTWSDFDHLAQNCNSIREGHERIKPMAPGGRMVFSEEDSI